MTLSNAMSTEADGRDAALMQLCNSKNKCMMCRPVQVRLRGTYRIFAARFPGLTVVAI